MSTFQVYILPRRVFMVLTYREIKNDISPVLHKIPLIIHNNHLYFMSDELKNMYTSQMF